VKFDIGHVHALLSRLKANFDLDVVATPETDGKVSVSRTTHCDSVATAWRLAQPIGLFCEGMVDGNSYEVVTRSLKSTVSERVEHIWRPSLIEWYKSSTSSIAGTSSRH
jgi:hypothetical protein